MEKTSVKAEPSSTEIGHGVQVQDELLFYTLVSLKFPTLPLKHTRHSLLYLKAM
jgi:hypothetical protein